MKISFRRVVEIHRNSIIKNGTTEGFFNVFIFRKISIIISWILAYLNVNPNIVTTISFLSCIAGGVLLFIDFDSYKIISIIFITLGFILDMSDGEVAKLTNKQSNLGGFYDSFFDRIIDIALPLLFGMGFFLSLDRKDLLLLFFMICYVTIRSSIFYLDYTNLKLGLSESIESIRKIGVLKFRSITKFIKWDGGFIVVLYSLAIFLEKIDLLFIFLTIYYGLMMCMGFVQISKNLKK